MLYSHIINMLIYTYTCSCTYIHIYAGYIPTQWITTSEAFFWKICTSLFIVRVRKGLLRVLNVRGNWRPNRTAIYWLPLLWSSALCLSRSPGLLNRRPRGPAVSWMMAFFTASYNQLVSKTSSRIPRTLRPGVPFPTTSRLSLCPITNWLPVLTELYNSSSPTQSPTQSLEWHVWSSSSENNCHPVQRSLSSSASVYECIMGFLPCPISSAKSTHAISFDHWPLECVTSFFFITLEWHVCRVEGQNTTLNREFKKLWNMQVTIIPIVIGAFGTHN